MRLALCLVVLVLSLPPATPAWADDGGDASSREERLKRAAMHEKIAQLHRNMADCLRSEKPMEDCLENCPGRDGAGRCPYMDETSPRGMGPRHWRHGPMK